MDKGIGFSRTITLDWMDVTATLCVQKIEPGEIRTLLAKTISDTVHGVEAQRKTIDVLSAIWIKTGKSAPKIHQDALEIYPSLSSVEERLWLHYGMTLVCYSIFRKCTASIGQISRIEETITRKMIKDRIAGDYGHLGALDRSVERIIASLTNWGIISYTDSKEKYKIRVHYFSANEKLQSWLLACALNAHPSEWIPYKDLVHLPEFFPFNLTIGVETIRRDSRFEVQRQGGGLEMVKFILE